VAFAAVAGSWQCSELPAAPIQFALKCDDFKIINRYYYYIIDTVLV
jgi:hypothetical protein